LKSRNPKDALDWCVYFLRCSDGSLYCGITNNLEARLAAHNNGTGAKYTRSRGPCLVVYVEQAEDRADASRREHSLKRLSRAAKLTLVDAHAQRTRKVDATNIT